jgi:hypothetical protein
MAQPCCAEDARKYRSESLVELPGAAFESASRRAIRQGRTEKNDVGLP